MQLIPIPSRHTDYAFKDGAVDLAESCVEECSIDQLRMLIAREERQLVRMDDEGKTVGWGVFRIENLPNMRVFFVTNLVGHHSRFERFYSQLKELAKDLGCSRIRFAAKPAQARLYRMKLGAESIYSILEVNVT